MVTASRHCQDDTVLPQPELQVAAQQDSLGWL